MTTPSGSLTNIYARPRLAAGRRPRPETRADSDLPGTANTPASVGYQVTNPRDFELRRFADPGNLHSAFEQLRVYGGPGAGDDGLTFTDYSFAECKDIFSAVSAAILRGEYRPHPTREASFHKPSGKIRTLQLQRVTDRAVSKALQICLGGYWREQLPRLGRGTPWIHARLYHAIHQQRKYVLAIDDIKDCFPSARIDEVMRWQRHHIDQPDLLGLIERIIRGHDDLGHLVGLDQGSPYSPTAMEAYLHHCLDTEMETRYRRSTLSYRYADNLIYLCDSVSEGEEILEAAGEVLNENHLTLKGEDGPPKDIRDPDYNQVVLGLIPTCRNGQPGFRVPESAFEHLSRGLHESNDHENPVAAAKWVAHGWTDAIGPALTRSIAEEVANRVIEAARTAGFRQVTLESIRETICRSRDRWQRMLRRTESC